MCLILAAYLIGRCSAGPRTIKPTWFCWFPFWFYVVLSKLWLLPVMYVTLAVILSFRNLESFYMVESWLCLLSFKLIYTGFVEYHYYFIVWELNTMQFFKEYNKYSCFGNMSGKKVTYLQFTGTTTYICTYICTYVHYVILVQYILQL
jgi:hypothetical protein